MPSSGSGSAASITSTGYPTASDVSTRLTAMGLTAPSNTIINAEINAAISAWESAVGYAPFLADSTDTTWYFEPNGTNIIDFGQDDGPGGFISITSVTTEVTYGNSTGVARVSGRDYQLKPANAITKGEPYTYLVTKWVLIDTGEASCKVIGKAGYCETLPADVYTAILKDVLVRLTPQLAITESGGAESLKQGPVEWKYGSGGGTFAYSADLMSSEAKACAMGYRRVKVA